MHYHNYRLDHLMAVWQMEVKEYSLDLEMCKDPGHERLAKKMQNISEDLVKKLLKLFVNRCRFIHALAFL